MLPSAATALAAEPIAASNDALRTSWYPDEPGLSPASVAGGNFGPVFETPVQGQVYAQPLVSDGTLLVATEDNWIYGLDSRSGAVRWSRNVGTPFNPAEIPGCTDLMPNVGITGTPVIDPDTGLAYFFAKTYALGKPVWEMHAVSVAGGQEAPGFPLRISGEAENISGVQFNPKQQLQRPALLLMDGVVYAGFGSHCDNRPYQGWLVGVSTGAQVLTMFATGPEGSSVWQAGAGLASDGPGQILFATGNSFEPTPPKTDTPPEDLGESVARVTVQPDGSLAATDFFSPYNREALDNTDQDFGSTAPTLLPTPYFGTPAHPHLAVIGGKEGPIYLLDSDDLGGFGQGPGEKDEALQVIPGTRAVIGSIAVWPGEGGYVYVPGGGGIRVLSYDTEIGEPHLSLAGETTEPFAFGSGSPIVTSDGITPGSAVLWDPQCPTTGCAGSTLNAYAAVPEHGAPRLLWRGPIGIATKFARPGVADGRVYVGTRDNRLIAFGVPDQTPGVSGVDGGSAGSGQVVPRGAPQTRISAASLHPASGIATFRFRGVGGAERFECRLLRTARGTAGVAAARKSAFRRCASPKTYRNLAPGYYRFEVRAVNAAGVDPTPAKRRFRL
jgi:hypothetical protein